MRWTCYQPTKTISPIVKAGIVTLSLIVVSGGITFASLTSQNTLTGNTIRTATANLKLSLDNTNFASTQTGYTFDSIVPGGPPVPVNGYKFYVKNFGTSPLSLKFSISNSFSNPDGADLSKVHIFVSYLSAGGLTQNFTLQSLIDSYATGGLSINSPTQVAAGATAGFQAFVTMDSDAVVNASATISNIDFNVNGLLTP